MKRFKFIYLLAAVVGALSFASCQHPYADWTPGAKDANMGVYFTNTNGFEVSIDDTNVVIEVARVRSEEAASVTLRYEAKDAAGAATELFTVPSKVDFAAGSEKGQLTIGFDASKLVMGKKYSIAIKLDEEQASTYAVSEATFTILLPEPWTSMGTGIYFDEILCELFAEADAFRGQGAYVEFEKNDLDANRIRVKNPFSFDVLGSMWGLVPGWLAYTATDDVYLEFDITDPNNVRVGDSIELDGKAAQYFMFNLNLPEDNYDLCCVVYDSTPIVLVDGIIKFPVGSVVLGVFQNGEFMGWFTNTANANGFMQYYLPGTEFVNFDMEASYDGMYVSTDCATAKAIFSFALGADIASYKFAFVPGDVTADPSATAEAIVAGSEDLKIFDSPADTKSWEVELTKGVWTLVAVPYNEAGEARLQNTYALNFYFNGPGEMPVVNLDVQVGTPASFAAEENKEAIEAETPACFWIGLNIAGPASEIKAMKAWWGTTSSYESVMAGGMTHDAIFADYAADLGQYLEKMAETDAVTVRMNVNNHTPEYTVLFRAQTIYGTVIEKKLEYTLPAYDGDFAVGEYMFSDASTQSQMVFALIPGKSYNDFYFVHNYVDGSMWYTKYDAEAGTLTNEGVELGYESYKSQWGGIYGAMNEELTQVYGYISSTTADYAEMAPMVMSVENNAIAGLKTYFGMLVYGYDAATDTVGDVLGAYFNFTPAAEIAPAAGALQAGVKCVNAKFNAKMAEMQPCVVDSVIASEAKLVIEATPVVRNFAMANLSLN